MTDLAETPRMPFDPKILQTPRLVLRPPRDEDAQSIFDNYASDHDVTRFVSWPRHETVEDSRRFIELSHSEWARWPAGPLLIESRVDKRLIGATGLAFEKPYRASTGYVLSQGAWGAGFATEAVRAVARLAQASGVLRLYAVCHAHHFAAVRVLERSGFLREGVMRRYRIFPNLHDPTPQDVGLYART
ncbi:MAG TPA: GNAT family N-acetyltransferase [Candidatus Limnocylindrales bacterium]|nr:GNAT family N-acetyltransferase [Candidatus Limnocylindrales bacterium]